MGSVTGNVGGNVTAVVVVWEIVSGNVTGSVGSIATGGITAPACKTDSDHEYSITFPAVTEIQTD